MEKCGLCNKESISKNLCLECNSEKGYYYIKKHISTNAYENELKECIKDKEKPSNFYFNKEKKAFEPCYEKCATCQFGGDGNENNCTSCENNYIFKPDIIGSTNCVIKCSFYYYYSTSYQYKCTNDYECPKDNNLLINEKGKCIDNCEKDSLYKYQYNGLCFKECPNNTNHEENEFICKDANLNKCFLSENKMNSLNENITDDEVEKLAKSFAKEFNYTDNHISVYKNDIYSITLYKNSECISDLSLTIPQIDFGECYNKVKNTYKIEENLIIAIISKKINGINYPKMASNSRYEPEKGEKLEFNDICKDETVVVQENLLVKMDNSTDLNSLFFLAGQNIDIFNLSSAFYTDICYHFKSPVEGKDIALKDRIKLYFPNITLCEDGCHIKGVNLTTFKAICECLLNNIMGSNLFGNNILYQSSLGELESMIQKTNIEVIKCYKDVFELQYFVSNSGGFLILSLILIQIILIIIYLCKSLYSIRKYVFGITDKFLSYLTSQNNKALVSNNINSLSMKENKLIKYKEPPKKRTKIGKEKENENKKGMLKRNGKKKKSNRNIVKRKSLIPKSYILKNVIVENNYQNNFSINTSSKNYSGNMNNPSLSNSLNRTRKKALTRFKKNEDEIFINSNEFLNKYKLSHPSIQSYNKSSLMINLNEEIDINIQEYLNTEPDDMDYDDALKLDKRTFCQFFLDKLKIKQMILNTFFTKDPLRPRPLKIILFILDIDLYLVINGLFFNEDYISQMFKVSDDEGILPFIERFMERFFYITLVGVIVSYIIECFFVDEKKIKGIFKREKENIFILKYEITQIIKSIISRNNYFIIFSFVITILSLYYVFCFNNIYPSMKGEWIKTSVIIIFSMQALSVLQSFLETSIRFISFKCKSEKIYKISLLLS